MLSSLLDGQAEGEEIIRFIHLRNLILRIKHYGHGFYSRSRELEVIGRAASRAWSQV